MTVARTGARESATVASCSGRTPQAGELGLEQAPDLLVGEAAPAQPIDRRGDNRLAGAVLVGFLLGTGVAGDERAGAVPELDDALVLELAVRLGHRVRVDHEVLRQGADAGQLFAGP